MVEADVGDKEKGGEEDKEAEGDGDGDGVAEAEAEAPGRQSVNLTLVQFLPQIGEYCCQKWLFVLQSNQ
ncbi:hypothetical protein LOK49_LG03G01703 [Camellia lanceoleosa]|uniref:Uncharacterized protein n=1 Tax=Camellia lanceoleosa TaxID=1840588 RepID=A0ACC0IB98_9ERIC|nr:hypothetical protein LOK49_LG03G01703 [Camellia lanceoleosa]